MARSTNWWLAAAVVLPMACSLIIGGCAGTKQSHVEPGPSERDALGYALGELASGLSAGLPAGPPKLRVLVLPFTTTESQTSEFGRLVADRLHTEMTKAARGRYEVMDPSAIEKAVKIRSDFWLDDLDKVADDLKAGHVLRGTYTRIGPAMASLSATVTDLRTGASVASESAPLISLDPPIAGLIDSGQKYLAAAGGIEVYGSLGKAEDLSVKLWVDKGDGATYREGDPLTILFRTTEDAYVTILDFQTSGEVRTLFPNCITKGNSVKGGVTYSIPPVGEGYVFTIARPAGTERLKAIVTERPRPISEPPLCYDKGTVFRSIERGNDEGYRTIEMKVNAVPVSEKAVGSTYFLIR